MSFYNNNNNNNNSSRGDQQQQHVFDDTESRITESGFSANSSTPHSIPNHHQSNYSLHINHFNERQAPTTRPTEEILQQAVNVAASLSRARTTQSSRLEQVAQTLSRAQQLHSTATTMRMNMTSMNSASQQQRRRTTRLNSSSGLPSSPSSSTASFAQSAGSSFPSQNSLVAALDEEPRTRLNRVRTDNNHQLSSQQQGRPRTSGTVNPSVHPQFRSKVVVKIFCSHCDTEICNRGMKAILLGNTKVELYSTDMPPNGVQLVYSDYTTQNCLCRIRDGACLGCGNVLGYHVTQPCEGCLEACNNGHFWMFHSDGVASMERFDDSGKKILRWAALPTAEEDLKSRKVEKPDLLCR